MQIQDPTYTYWHLANAAKAIECVSTAVGIVGGFFSAQEIFSNEYGTVTQITTLAIPTLIILGNTVRAVYEKCHGRKISKKMILPMPYLLGVDIGITVIALKALSSQCYNYRACPGSKSWFVDECDEVMDMCHHTLDSQNAWYPLTTWIPKGTMPNQYCSPIACPPILCATYTSMSDAIKQFCQFVYQPSLNFTYPLDICSSAWNLKDQYQMIVLDLRDELFNQTRCSLSAEDINFINNRNTWSSIIAGSALALFGGSHPLIWNNTLWQFRLYKVNRETDPILSQMQNPQENPVKVYEIILENL